MVQQTVTTAAAGKSPCKIRRLPTPPEVLFSPNTHREMCRPRPEDSFRVLICFIGLKTHEDNEQKVQHFME